MRKLILIFSLAWLMVLTVSPELHPVRAEEREVGIQNFAFAPKEVVISAGATVTWTQKDGAPHTVTAKDGSFDSGTLAQGERFSQTFSRKGVYEYICRIHPSMTGKITVK